jgi:integrase
MQTGWVERHGRGWRGGWREHGTKRYTAHVTKKGDARALLNDELRRIKAQHDASPRTREKVEIALKQPLALWGTLPAGDLTPELINRWLVTSAPKPASRQTYPGALRQVYGFGITNNLVEDNPARRAKTPTVRRSDGLLPFESWQEVERVAEGAGRWEPLIIIAADTGARPGELALLEHRHITQNKVYLPGTKTRRARRVVTLTPGGVAAHQSRPIDWHNWRHRVWQPALELAGLDRRGPYQLRHTLAYFSLRAGVPISDLSVEMGHESIRLTHETYGLVRRDGRPSRQPTSSMGQRRRPLTARRAPRLPPPVGPPRLWRPNHPSLPRNHTMPTHGPPQRNTPPPQSDPCPACTQATAGGVRPVAKPMVLRDMRLGYASLTDLQGLLTGLRALGVSEP